MHERNTAAISRWVAARAVFAFFLFWSAFLAYLIGWSLQPKGLHRVLDHIPILLASLASGAVAVVRRSPSPHGRRRPGTARPDRA